MTPFDTLSAPLRRAALDLFLSLPLGERQEFKAWAERRAADPAAESAYALSSPTLRERLAAFVFSLPDDLVGEWEAWAEKRREPVSTMPTVVEPPPPPGAAEEALERAGVRLRPDWPSRRPGGPPVLAKLTLRQAQGLVTALRAERPMAVLRALAALDRDTFLESELGIGGGGTQETRGAWIALARISHRLRVPGEVVVWTAVARAARPGARPGAREGEPARGVITDRRGTISAESRTALRRAFEIAATKTSSAKAPKPAARRETLADLSFRQAYGLIVAVSPRCRDVLRAVAAEPKTYFLHSELGFGTPGDLRGVWGATRAARATCARR